ncbi:FKBP-type peptidyl-prolyl cis-trans isomerase [Pontibacter sp. Tf4]|uniref:FKBP-type peptidyl-prolyl cis-trans isomerase n=1 Tax=Pontibacter sp. Tf4 TaxID=2761620 RepID=UPI001626103D|nr:FKBP-type peptidyl-prolyl cis-trans isomerase [Pontibacter sp. Tf4]MBB6611473.1 FKBP-type peptidyl-prolyl cis-trans isomerase [Pontibacter sp. Tf4]
MLSKIKFLLPVIAGAVMVQACNKNNDEFYKTGDGLSYRIFEKNDKGEYKNKGEVNPADSVGAKIGQVVTFHWAIKNSEDSTFADTRTQGPKMPIILPLMQPSMKGGLENALAMLAPGDSGVFKINADTLFAKTFGQPLPPFIKPGSELTFFINMQKVQSKADAEADYAKMMEEQMEKAKVEAEKQLKVDDAKIQAYIKENNLQNVQKTQSGVYYVVTKEGNGPKAKFGDVVAVHYKGTFLDGKEFDNSRTNPMAAGKPFEFTLGQGQVIKGWDDGVSELKEGSEAILLIPSPLAYGAQDRGPDMPANSVLRFDVELVDVK